MNWIILIFAGLCEVVFTYCLGLSRMLMLRFDIEHLTGKEAIELTRKH